MKKLLFCLSLILSTSVFANYKIYPQGENKLNLPEIKCREDVSALEDGMYILCSQEDDIEYPVVNGQAFKLSAQYPEEAFNCPQGEKYLNNKNKGYAYNSDAMDLASLTGKNVYTPYKSFLPVYSSTNEEDAKGNIRYIKEDGSFGQEEVYQYSSRYTVLVHKRYKVTGTSLSIKEADESLSKFRAYYPRVRNDVKIANRACLI